MTTRQNIYGLAIATAFLVCCVSLCDYTAQSGMERLAVGGTDAGDVHGWQLLIVLAVFALLTAGCSWIARAKPNFPALVDLERFMRAEASAADSFSPFGTRGRISATNSSAAIARANTQGPKGAPRADGRIAMEQPLHRHR